MENIQKKDFSLVFIKNLVFTLSFPVLCLYVGKKFSRKMQIIFIWYHMSTAMWMLYICAQINVIKPHKEWFGSNWAICVVHIWIFYALFYGFPIFILLFSFSCKYQIHLFLFALLFGQLVQYIWLKLKHHRCA